MIDSLHFFFKPILYPEGVSPLEYFRKLYIIYLLVWKNKASETFKYKEKESECVC